MFCDCCGDHFRRPGSNWCNECERELNDATEPAPTPIIAWMGVLVIFIWAVWEMLK